VGGEGRASISPAAATRWEFRGVGNFPSRKPSRWSAEGSFPCGSWQAQDGCLCHAKPTTDDHPFPSSPPRPLSFQARGSIGESLLDGDIPASWFGAVIMEDHRSNARLQL